VERGAGGFDEELGLNHTTEIQDSAI